MKYELFQFTPAAWRDHAFKAYDPARRVELRHYHTTCLGIVDGEFDSAVLDRLFRKFNIDHPSDFRGSSMSVGDVVLLDDERLYYCD